VHAPQRIAGAVFPGGEVVVVARDASLDEGRRALAVGERGAAGRQVDDRGHHHETVRLPDGHGGVRHAERVLVLDHERSDLVQPTARRVQFVVRRHQPVPALAAPDRRQLVRLGGLPPRDGVVPDQVGARTRSQVLDAQRHLHAGARRDHRRAEEADHVETRPADPRDEQPAQHEKQRRGCHDERLAAAGAVCHDEGQQGDEQGTDTAHGGTQTLALLERASRGGRRGRFGRARRRAGRSATGLPARGAPDRRGRTLALLTPAGSDPAVTHGEVLAERSRCDRH